jgi:transcriptional regulator with XRE-family HTH domain
MSEREHYWLLRRKKKIKLRDIANYLGCTVAHVSAFENGKSNLSSDKLILYKKYITETNNSTYVIVKVNLT